MNQELINYVAAKNAEKVAWMEETGGWTGLYPTDEEYWKDIEVSTVEELEEFEMFQTYYDLYKEVYGFRPRHETPTGKELREEVDYLYVQLEQVNKHKEENEKRLIEKFESYISEMMKNFGIDRETAIRWDMEAEEVHVSGDDDFYKYLKGIPYNYNLMGV